MADADERAIRELVEIWMKASKTRDVETVLGLMTDDAIFMVPGREPFSKEEFRATSEAMGDATMDGRAEVREIQVAGDWAWIRNHLEVSVTPPGGEPNCRSGYTLTVLRKCGDGRWRLFRDANLLS